MRSLKTFALFLCFLYFLALVMGYPEIGSPSARIIKITEEGVEPKPEFYWKTGILKRIYLQDQALTAFEDKLLEGDTKPEEIFRRLHRSLIQDIFFLVLSLLWVCLLGLCSLNLKTKHIFLDRLSTLLLLFFNSIFFVKAVRILSQKDNRKYYRKPF